MSSLKAPPAFNPDEGDEYIEWKTDVEVWQAYTDTAKAKQGPAIYLCLRGKARDAVRGLDVKDIATEDGVKSIIDKLDGIFQKDETTRAYCAFKEFIEYRRRSGDNFSEFMIAFDKRYRDVKRYKMELPDGVQAFFLLNA